MLVVTLKYVMLILRADNRGEGGGLALTALAAQAVSSAAAPAPRVAAARRVRRHAVLRRQRDHAGDLGARRDGRPARSSHRRSSPMWCPSRWRSWSRCSRVQRFGTATVGRLFGPVIVLWFATLAVIGTLAHRPAAGDPGRARTRCRPGTFLADRGWQRVARGRRHRAGAHRRRGAVRRHGPLRSQADPAGLDTAWCCRRWRSTTWARARC